MLYRPACGRGESYITKVFDYMPAVGQFTNTLPLYEEGGIRRRQ